MMNLEPSDALGSHGGFPGAALDELIALLRSMVEVYGMRGAAQQLGVSYRTVYRWQEEGALGPKLRDALARRLDPHLNTGLNAMDDRIEAVERSLGELRSEVESLASSQPALAEALDELTHRQEEHVRALSRQIADVRQEAGSRDHSNVEARPEGADEVTSAADAPPAPPGGEHSHHVAFERVCAEWERAKSDVANAKSGLDRARALLDQRRSEIALLNTFEASIPPGESWGYWRRRQGFEWRIAATSALETEIRHRMFRQWIRRILTLGLWRS